MGHYQLDCGCYVDCNCEPTEYVYYNENVDDFMFAYIETEFFTNSRHCGEKYYYVGVL